MENITENLTITMAKPNDILQINDILNYAIINSNFNLNTQTMSITDTTIWFNEHKAQNYPIIVALVKNKVVGWASLSKFRNFSGYNQTAEVSIYVHYNYYKNGIGEKLLKALEDEAKERGFHSIISVITANNTPSLNLHKKFNFAVNGTFREIAFKNGKYVDVVFMSKIL